MHKFNALFFVLALAAPLANAAASLVGTWKSSNANNGALPGTLVLRKDNTLVLRAKDQPEFSGAWSVPKEGVLTLTIPDVGKSDMEYRFKTSRLVLTYDNGNTQEFVRKTRAPRKGASK